MKIVQKWVILMTVLGLVFGLIGCPTEDDGKKGEDDIFLQKPDGKLLTGNLSAEDLVLFHSTVIAANFLGGLPGNAYDHRIRLPDSNRLYVIYAVKYSDYKNASSSQISGLKVLDSALVYSDPLMDTSCRIGDPKAGGTAEMRFTNQTGYFIEVGDGSAGDEDRFYVMRPNSTDSVFVQPKTDGYTLYMTLNLPMKKSGKITGVQRRFIDGWTRIVVPKNGTVENVLIDKAEVDAATPSYKEGYLRIVNGGGRGYRVRNGSQPISSTLGFSAISDGDEQVWELLGEDNEIGRPYASFNLEAGQAANNLTIASFNIRNGYKYTLYINPDSAEQKYTISAGTPLDPDEEEISW